MVVRAVITLLCGIGLYVSLFMLSKSRRAQRGELHEPSVVTTPRARLFGVQNAALGVIYYLGVAIAIWLIQGTLAKAALLAVVLFAALTSVVLAYSLLFITRRDCPYCWTGHAVNWSIFFLFCWLFRQPS